MVTDGPFTEAKEVLGGYWMIEVNSREEAIAWAKTLPGLQQRDHRDPPGAGNGRFPADVQEAAAGFAELQAGSGKN